MENQQKEKPKGKPFCLCVIVTEHNTSSIAYYNEQFRELNKLYNDKVRLLFFGYRPESDKFNILDGVDYEYVNPVSKIHYFKQLRACEIDLLFIPLANDNEQCIRNELHIRYAEVGQSGIPIIAPNIYPYSLIIKNDLNGFLFENRERFIPYMKDLLYHKVNDKLVKICGKASDEFTMKNFNFSNQHLEAISTIYN
jgi:hypothetical protein